MPATYVWNGVLVSFDETLKTMTVKARLFGPQAMGDPGRFKPGDRVLLVLVRIRRLTPTPNGRSGHMMPLMSRASRFQFPAQFVSSEAGNNDVTIKLPVPQAAALTMKALKPGDWVRVRARQRPSSEADAVVDVKPFASLEQ